MLMNNLDPDVAERPDELVVYGGTGKAARSWEAFDAIVRELRTLGDDETLLVQSGKPVGVFRTHEWAPRVLIANSNLVPRVGDLGRVPPARGARADDVRADDGGLLDLHREPGHRAGHLRVLRRIARRRFGGSLAGTITLTAGLGGMGGAQPLAVTMNEGVVLCVEVDRDRIRRRHRDALPRRGGRRSRDAVGAACARSASGARCSVGLCANAAEVLRELLRQGSRPTSSPSRPARTIRSAATCRPGSRSPRPRRCAASDPDEYIRRARAVGGRALLRDGRLHGRRRGGVRLRQQPARRGEARRLRARLRLPGLRAGLHPAAVLRGQGPVPLGGAVGRPGGHRRDRPRDARGVPRRRAGPLDPHGAASGSPSRACRRGSAGSATASGAGSGCASTRWCGAASSARRS